jgi:2-dehydropantoate 2-reductase
VPQAEPIIVLGAGAIGSVYAVKLSARHPVTVVVRPDHAAAIRADGLRLIGRETVTARVDAVTGIDTIAPGTIILLTTKVNASEAALAPVAHLVRDDTVIVCVQNGLDSEGIARSAVGGRGLVLRAITQFGAIFQEPGVVNYTASGYTLLEDGPRSADIAALLTASGLEGRISPDIKTEIWRKLIYNCVINPITAITGTVVGGIADPKLDPLKQLVIDECLAVARSQGVAFSVDFLSTITEVFAASRTIASMRQDLIRGRPTEIDHMNGAVADLGRRNGINCPVNAALTAIIKALDRCTMSS